MAFNILVGVWQNLMLMRLFVIKKEPPAIRYYGVTEYRTALTYVCLQGSYHDVVELADRSSVGSIASRVC